ncbi:uncharacterized protein STEHIDRAFT_135501 [Stereum hirsutum FP-91666 SS1]|uniref:Uncharacterized protein n=1 Tax=Stereum hirsutum (strain FP-91666) TaxID=721885 RepID=R7RY14_STEHR|nr:uncharacterized protein STEHIDRAFT_135501 [Stereum hirsutum FP-91666 SS1]EIM80224.1 hypothetical protein STEHIDRAFT_135501 [Stereum hirsutum FP-91666 SS1]
MLQHLYHSALVRLRSPPTPTGQGSTSTKRSLSRDAKAFNEDRARFADDPGCFLTGFSCLSLEAAHLVNTLHFLTSVLAIVRRTRDFTLESLENMVLLYPPYHRHLDLYATYSITLCKDSLQEVIEILREANLEWDRLVALPAPSSLRDIPVRILSPARPHQAQFYKFRSGAKSALVHMKFDLILLHPALFLPRGQHLVALKTHEPPTYADWAVIDRELRERNSPSDSAPYPPFSYTSRKRTTLDYLRYHEQKYAFDDLTDRQLELAQLTLEAYDLVLYRPSAFVVEPLPTAVPSMPPLPRQIAASHQVSSNGASIYQDDEERSDSVSETGSELLSPDESHRILARLEDPSTTLEERKDLVDLLLDGARPYRPFPVVPGVELPEVPSLFGHGGHGS